jgi:glycosyltransferase involved in cell wall biosynthesis
VGPYPEPLGGVSVYIKRMKEYLDSLGIANQVWDISPTKKVQSNVFPTDIKWTPFRHLLRMDIQLIHYHLFSYRSKIYIGLLNRLFFKQRKKILTIHGAAGNMFGMNDQALLRALNSFDAIICVKSGDRQYLIEQGVVTLIREISAFIFPGLIACDMKMPVRIEDFMYKHPFIITANASALRFHNKDDLYGLDMCIELMARLKRTYPQRQLGFIFGLSEVRDHDYFQTIKQLIQRNGIEDDFLLLTEKLEFYPIIKKSQLFIRPTNTDGFSVSLAEAIHFKVPVVASDIVQRPTGTILFHTRDHDDLYRKVVEVICQYEDYRAEAKNLSLPNNAEQVWQLYQEVIAEKVTGKYCG